MGGPPDPNPWRGAHGPRLASCRAATTAVTSARGAQARGLRGAPPQTDADSRQNSAGGLGDNKGYKNEVYLWPKRLENKNFLLELEAKL